MSSGTTSIDGLMSGLDTTSIIAALTNIQSAPLTLVNNRITQRSQDVQSYQALTAKMIVLGQSVSSLADGSLLKGRQATVSDSSAVVATASSGAALGSYQLTVEQLAQCHKISSGTVADTATALNMAGDVSVNGHTITLGQSDTLTDLRDKINQAQAGVSASIVTVSSTDHRLVLRSTSTGTANALDLKDVSSNALQSLGLLNSTVCTKHAVTNGMKSDALTSATAAVGTTMGLSSAPAGTIQINGTDVAVDLSTDSLNSLAARINQTVTGVQASVQSETTTSGTRYRLQLTGDTTPTLTDNNNVLQTLGVQSQGVAHELQAAQDAKLDLDGYSVTRSTNSIDDVLEGVSLDLQVADKTQTLALTVGPSNDSAVSAMQQLVTNYNAVVDALNTGQSYDTSTESGGVFFGDASILSLQDGLHQTAMSSVSSLGGSLTLMSQVGLSTDQTGHLVLNATKLETALTNNPDAVGQLLTTQAQASSDEVSYVSATAATADSGSAGYAVEITQAATKAQAQSASLASGLTQDETLTLNGQYSVSLKAGMTLQQAADKLNQIISGNKLPLSVSVAGDHLQFESTNYGASYGFSVSSSLADGSGGTDLGGAVAGATQAYYGQNVAGTIGGKKAEGYGQWLTGSEGSAKGLKLQIKSDTVGSKGVVKVSQGFASRLNAFCNSAVDADTGVLTRATTSVTDQITTLRDEATKMQTSVDAYKAQLQTQFATMEGVVAKNKSLLSYLTGAVTSLKGLSVDTSA